MSLITETVLELQKITKTPFDQLNIVVCILLTFPIGYINRFIKNPYYRLIFGFLTGILLQIQMYGLGFLHIIIAATFTYLFMKFYGRKYSAFYVLFFNILYLSVLHIRKMLTRYSEWKIEVDALYMMSICKFSSIAFAYEDGGKNQEDIKSTYHKAKLVRDKPSLLEVFSYIFYYSTSLCGPSFEFADFKKFIYLEEEYKDIPWSKCNRLALTDFSLSLACIIIIVLIGPIFQTAYCGSDEYMSYNILYKTAYFLLSMVCTKYKYYIAWKMSQASCMFTGLSHCEHKIDKIDNCNLYNIEINLNVRTRIQYWNRSVHIWLKYHVYMRLVNLESKLFKNNKALASLVTFMVSAFWHGFYPVYYLFFFLYYIIEQCAVALDEKFDFFTWINKQNFVLKFIWWWIILFFMHYYGIVFALLKMSYTLKFFNAFYHIPNIILFSAYYYLCIYTKKK